VPIIEQGKIIGIVSRANLVQALASASSTVTKRRMRIAHQA